MNELLTKLLNAEVLTEETKQELEAAFTGQLDKAIQEARAEAQATVTAELNEAWITERDTLIEAIDARITEDLTNEMAELRADIERFRDLEAEYASRIVEAKAEMASTLKKDVAQLIEHLDSFLTIRLTSELEELREDITEVRKQEFGKKVFEAFISEFKQHYAGDDSVEARLTETEERLNATLAALEESKKRAAVLERSIRMEKVLAPLSGRTKEVMEAILKHVDTPMLEEAYKTYIGRVLKDASQEASASEKETPVLAEGEKTEEIRGVVKSGDNQAVLREQQESVAREVKAPTISDAERARIRRMAGLA